MLKQHSFVRSGCPTALLAFIDGCSPGGTSANEAVLDVGTEQVAFQVPAPILGQHAYNYDASERSSWQTDCETWVAGIHRRGRSSLFLFLSTLLSFGDPALAAAPGTPIQTPGPGGPLVGRLVDAGANAPVVVLLPGSGPTDSDGNNPLGVSAAPYRMLAEGLAVRGISSVRVNKRGIGGSAGDGNDVTVHDYVADTRSWITTIRGQTDAPCVWLLGHSEGALIALASAAEAPDVCGVISVSGPGRRLSIVLREQLSANPANHGILADAEAAIVALEGGHRVSLATLPAELHGLFHPKVQGFLISLFAHDPADLARQVKTPLLVVHGTADIQVSAADVERLAAARPGITSVVVPNMNHVWKSVSGDRASNLAAYADPTLPLSPGLVDEIADFVLATR